MCVYDYDHPTCYTEREVTARRPHRCTECCREIAVGERYLRTFGVWDKHADVFKTCDGCQLALAWLRDACGGWMHGDMLEEIRTHFDGEESSIWHLDELAAAGTDLRDYVPENKRATWRPPMTQVWLGRVAVGMRRKWRWSDGRPIARPAPFTPRTPEARAA